MRRAQASHCSAAWASVESAPTAAPGHQVGFSGRSTPSRSAPRPSRTAWCRRTAAPQTKPSRSLAESHRAVQDA